MEFFLTLANLVRMMVFIVAAAAGGSAQQAQNPTAQAAAGAADAQEVRFAVAHQHAMSWCYGYLYVSPDKVRYEVVQPQSNRNHSFEAQRTEVTVRQWVLMGQPQDVIELKVKGVIYHMRWLKNEAEVNTAGSKRVRPPDSAAPDTLISTIQNPGAASAQSQQTTNSVADGQASQGPRGSGGPGPPPAAAYPVLDESTANVPPGMLTGVYVALASEDARPSNKQFLFYPDGLMVNGVPEGGMIGFDFSHYRPESNSERNWVGRYKLEGDKIKIVWQNQFGDPANPAVYKRNETSAHPALDLGWQIFIPMCRCTGKTFSGTYRWGLPAADQYLQFFPDGTFIDHRVTDQLIVPSRFYEHPRIQRGTYSIQSQTIIFTFADGHGSARTFLAPKVQENQPMFDWIDLGRKMFFEENYRAKLSQ
jgi:hypothetical protein